MAVMEFRILGPLEVQIDGAALPLRGSKQRALLAALLLRANRVVSSEQLIDELWGEQPPDTAPNTLQVYVSNLRKTLGRDVVVTQPPGYLVRAGVDELDAVRFERLVAESHDLPAAEAAPRLREALALWRGPALADFAYEPFAQTEIARLEELRLAATEERIAAELALGRPADVVGELEALVIEHPLRERLRELLMLALYRSGRQAEALQEYQRTRSELVEQLGIDPGTALQRLEKAILVQDPSLDLAAAAAPPAPEPPPAPPRESRKTVTVVFTDLSAGGNGLDPEALARVAGRAVDTVARVLERHGASVAKLVGERVMAVFGVPSVHEDDALRAVRAAAELGRALAELNDELEQSFGVRVAARTGIDTGEVLAAGDASRLTGDAVNVAARLERLAGPDEVLIGAATERLVRDAARTKAAHGAEKAWRLIDVRADAPAVARHLDSPMVGRQLELAQLRQAFDRAVREQTCYLFTVLGPAGIGKSRLAAELRSAVQDEAIVLSGRCLPYGEGITYWPLAEIVTQAAGDGGRDAIAALLPEDDDAEAIAARVAAAIGAVEGGTGAAQAETFWAVRKLFEALARDRPLVVFFDEVHGAEPTLLDRGEHLADLTRDAPVLLVCLARPELFDERPVWGGGKLNATSTLLEPLSGPECEALIDNLLGRAPLPAATRGRIAEAADGNPLFVEQMLAMLSENGRGNGHLAIPPTIQALLAARLDRLDGGERGVLECASVVGKEFWAGAVSELSEEATRTELPVRLQALVRKELIRPFRSAFFGQDAFRFRHHLIRDVAYDSMSKQSRAELHERFYSWLEDTAGESAREYEEILGYHLEQSYRYRSELGLVDERARELARRAADRLGAAGLRAFGRGDIHAAVSLLSRAAALLPDDDPKRLELLPELGEALRSGGQIARSEEVLAEAIEAAAAAGNPAVEEHARLARLRVHMATRPELSTAEMIPLVDRAIRTFEELKDDRRLALALYVRAWVAWIVCRAGEAETAVRRAIDVAERAGDARAVAIGTHLYLGTVLFGPTGVPEGIRRCEEVLTASPDLRQTVAVGSRAAAGLNAMAGRFGEAFELIERDRAILAELGMRIAEGSAAGSYGHVMMLAGEYEAAEREFVRACELFEEIGDPISYSTWAANLAQALYHQGRFDEAYDATVAAEEAAQADDYHTQVVWRGPRAKVLARRGEHEEAVRLAREGVEIGDQTDFPNFRGDAYLDLGETLVLAGRAGEGREAIETARAIYEAKGNVVSTARAAERLAELT
jgi:DNA-binding SARP family transcriptional activator